MEKPGNAVSEKKKLNIAIIVPSNLPIPNVRGGAIETLVNYLVRENEDKQQLNIVVYSKQDALAKEAARELQQTEVVYIDGDGFPARVFSHIRNVKNQLKKGNRAFESYFLKKACLDICKRDFDFVIIEGNNIVCEYVKAHTNIPLVLHLHNRFYAASFRAEKIAQSTDFVFTVSDYIAQQAKTIGPLKDKPVITVHNCADAKIFDKEQYKLERDAIRQKYGVKEQDVLLIFTGRMVEEKGLYPLAEAVCQLAPNVKLMILGAATFDDHKQTDYTRSVLELVNSRKDKLFFTGFVNFSEIAKFYAAADIAVVPSLWEEPAGLAAIEALLTGLPLVATRSGGMPEYYNADCAISVEKSRETIVEDLRQAIDALSADENRRGKMGIAARAFIKKYDTENYYREYVAALEKCYARINHEK